MRKLNRNGINHNINYHNLYNNINNQPNGNNQYNNMNNQSNVDNQYMNNVKQYDVNNNDDFQVEYNKIDGQQENLSNYENIEEPQISKKQKTILFVGAISILLLVLVIICIVAGSSKKANDIKKDLKDSTDVVENMENNTNEIIATEELVSEEPTEDLNDEENQEQNTTSELNKNQEQTNGNKNNNTTVSPSATERVNYNNYHNNQNNTHNNQNDNTVVVTKTFEPKAYKLDVKDGKSVEVRIKGTRKAKVKGYYIYDEPKGRVTKNWEERLDDDGNGKVRFRINKHVETVEFYINDARVENRDTDREEVADCNVMGYEAK